MIRTAGSTRNMTALQMATESSTTPKSVMKTIVWLEAVGDSVAVVLCEIPAKGRRKAKSRAAAVLLWNVEGMTSSALHCPSAQLSLSTRTRPLGRRSASRRGKFLHLTVERHYNSAQISSD